MPQPFLRPRIAVWRRGPDRSLGRGFLDGVSVSQPTRTYDLPHYPGRRAGPGRADQGKGPGRGEKAENHKSEQAKGGVSRRREGREEPRQGQRKTGEGQVTMPRSHERDWCRAQAPWRNWWQPMSGGGFRRR